LKSAKIIGSRVKTEANIGTVKSFRVEPREPNKEQKNAVLFMKNTLKNSLKRHFHRLFIKKIPKVFSLKLLIAKRKNNMLSAFHEIHAHSLGK